MKRLNVIAATLLSSALPCHAGMIGWFDYAYIAMVDQAVGWVCENEDPYNTPSYGSLDVWINGGPGSGYFYGNYDLNPAANAWGFYKAGVNAAGYCGTDSYVGFDLSGWLGEPGHYDYNDIYVYWKDTNGNRTLLGGSPKHVTGPGYFY